MTGPAFIALCDEALDNADRVPAAGYTFADSVSGRIETMRAWAVKHNACNDNMVTAVTNMNAGLEKWLEGEYR
jgi:hypothetical protein